MKDLPKAAVLSCEGTVLTAAERELFRRENPLGFILFARNVGSREQLASLTDQLRDCVGRNAPVLIDQEGGRVQRIGPPIFREYPFAKTFGDMYEKDPQAALEALRENFREMSRELLSVGINVNCVPVLDVLTDRTHEIIGARAFSRNPSAVAALGGETARVLLEEGMVPVMKHLPGHGRTAADSHLELPTVDAALAELEETDFLPFREVAGKHPCWGMTTHIKFTAIDAGNPTTLSEKGIRNIRENIGFKGFLLSDDISMKALLGGVGDVSAQAIAAGCDAVLYCHGRMEEMEAVIKAVPRLSEEAYRKSLLPGETA